MAIAKPNRFALMNRFYHQFIAYDNVTGSGSWREVGRRRPVRRAVPTTCSIRFYLSGDKPVDRLNEITQGLAFNVHIRVDGNLNIEFFFNIKNQ